MLLQITYPDSNLPPKRTFTLKEVYQYGVLMSLAEEQSDAIEKLIRRELGWWGRARLQSRVSKMISLLEDIIRNKGQITRLAAIAAVRADLISIQHHGLEEEIVSEGALNSAESVLEQL